MSLYFFPVTLSSVSTSEPTPSLDMHPHTIMDGSPVLTVPSVQVGIHSSVDVFRHTNTLPSLPLFFMFDSSVKTTFFQNVIVFLTISVAHCILFFSFFVLINGFLRACLPLYPDDFNLRLVVLSLTVLLMLAPYFFAKVFADDLWFSFTSLVRHLFSLSVVNEGLPERFIVLIFPLNRNFEGWWQ